MQIFSKIHFPRILAPLNFLICRMRMETPALKPYRLLLFPKDTMYRKELCSVRKTKKNFLKPS
jgi:hypothetical protein